jgi:hypothetical protein
MLFFSDDSPNTYKCCRICGFVSRARTLIASHFKGMHSNLPQEQWGFLRHDQDPLLQVPGSSTTPCAPAAAGSIEEA